METLRSKERRVLRKLLKEARRQAGLRQVDLAAIAAGCGVPYTVDVTAEEELDAEMDLAFSRDVCSFINVRTRPGHSHVRPRRTDGIEDKYRFVRYVERPEGIWITGVPPQDIALMKGRDR